MRDRKNVIKAGYLLSYDYAYIFTSLKLIYEHVDSIVISYDADGKTWAGNDIYIPESFFSEIKDMDQDHKITFYKDQFYVPGMQPFELDTRQRNMMAEKMGPGGWHIQIDSDEYPYDFKILTDFLRENLFLIRNPKISPVNFLVHLVVLFKQDSNGFFVIEPYNEACVLVTNNPVYDKPRRPKTGKDILLDYYMIHQSWARTAVEIKQKIENWGHRDDFDVDAFYKKWLDLEENTIHNYIDFHPLAGSSWEKLGYFKSDSIQDFITSFETSHLQKKITLKMSKTKRIKIFLKSLFRS